MRLIDAPIDLAGLVPPSSNGSARLLQKPTMPQGSGGDLFDFSNNLAFFNDGPSKSFAIACAVNELIVLL
jgi:hypothetical protein